MKQIYPASITGKSFAAGGSVLDHAFGKSDPYTLGVEEEYMLLDNETFDLVQHIDTVLAATTGHELESRINTELMQSVLEIATLPVPNTAQAGAKDAREKVMSFAEENINNSFDFAQKLVRAKDIQEVMALQQEFLKQQMQQMQNQAKDLGASAVQAAKPKG